METLKSPETPQTSEKPQMPELPQTSETPEATPKIHEIFSKLFFGLKRFLYFRATSHYTIVDLTIILSYFVPLFEALGYLHFNGRESSGKNVALDIIKLSGFNPSFVHSPTDAVLYRILHQRKGVLLWDEADLLSMPDKPGRGSPVAFQVLRGGYKPGGSVWRCDKNDPYGFITYDTYGLKVTANKDGIYDKALRSRYIVITMSEPNPDQQPEIFYPSSKDGELFSKIGKNLLQLSTKDNSLGNSIRNHYLNLRADERLREIRGRFFEIFSPYFALAKVIDESYGREFLFKHVLKFAKDYIDERNRDRLHIDPDTIILYFVWKYVKELSQKEGFAENEYFYGRKLWDNVNKNLTEYFGKLDFKFTLNRLGKILETHGFLIWPEKGKVMHVRLEEDAAKAPETGWHYHINVDGLDKFAEKSFKEFEEPDADKSPDKEHL